MIAAAVLLDPVTRRSERMRQLFAEYAPRDFAGLRATWSAGDAAELAKAAHRLKGGAYTFGAVRLGDAAAAIELAARAGRVPPEQAIEDLGGIVTATLEELAALPP